MSAELYIKFRDRQHLYLDGAEVGVRYHKRMKMSDETSPAGKNHNKYRKEKPWDDENVDHWKIEEWKPEFMSGPMLEE